MSAETPPSGSAHLIVLPQHVDAGWVERHLVVGARHASTPLRLSLKRVVDFDFFGEARLLGVLAGARRAHREIELHTEVPMDLAAGSPDRLVKLLKDTLAGVVLVQLATRLLDPSGMDLLTSVRQAQASTAISGAGIFGFGREWAAPIVDTFGGPPPSQLLMEGDEGYESLFVERVSLMNLGLLTDISLRSLVEFSYEAFDNTRQHGSRTLDRTPIEGVRFVLQRVLNTNRDRLQALSARVDHEPISVFLDAMAARLSSDTQLRLVELTVTDSGVGIPARMAGTEDVYCGNYEEELKSVYDAFALGTTTRVSHQGRGRGLKKIVDATRAVDGLLSLRTGRTHVSRSFADGEGAWRDTQSDFLPGTSVSLLFPWRAERQLTLDLDE